ncbi:MAG: hypothetical protein HY075_03145 [Deltaproteobacteria bacterium]|nr:hypothetical protein [Deltaproteobacteria bacterium]
MMTTRIAIATSLALATAFAACGPTDPAGFNGNDALGDYAVTVDTNVVLTTNYSVIVGTAGTKTTTAKVPYSVVTNSSTDPTFDTFDLSYDAANHKFVLTVSSNGGTPSKIDIAEETAVATAEDGTVSGFSPSLAHLKSVAINISLASPTVSDLSNGCAQLTDQDISLTITADGLSGFVHVIESFETHGIYEGTPAVPYVSCFDALAAIEARIRANQPETSSFPIYVANGATNIDHLTDVVSIEETVNLVGPKKATAASKGTLSIKNGTVTGFTVQR